MRKFRNIAILILLMTMSRMVFAVPAQQAFFGAQTTEGQSIELTLRGDEFYSWYEDQTGNCWIKEENGFRRAEQKDNLSGVRRAAQQRRVHQQTSASPSFPAKGKVRVVVLLTQYTDKSFVLDNPVEKFTQLFNENHYSANGSTGSVRDYYLASSNGALDIQFDVYGPYTLSHNEAYYGGNTQTSSTKNAQELVKEAAKLAEADGVNFSPYDNTQSGYIDLVGIITAGHNEAEGGSASSIWPHQNIVWSSTYVSGKALYSYLMISELRGGSGKNMANIGTFCHEFGHVLGLPDLYNTEDGMAYTVGTWDLMCSGCYNNSSRTPPVCSAFERFVLGWLTPEQLSSPGKCVLGSLETTNKAYILSATKHNLTPLSPSPSEYFMIENRQHEGWDTISSSLPGTGLLISHITFSKNKWDYNIFNNSVPLGYDIVEAYNTQPTQSQASDTYPGTAGITTFMPTFNNGNKLTSYCLTNIYERTNKKVAFTVGKPKDDPLYLTPDTLRTFISTYARGEVNYDEQVVTIHGENLSSDRIIISTSGQYQLSWDGETWSRSGETITDTVEDGTYSRPLHIRYAPTRQSCSINSGQMTIFSADSAEYQLLSLAGISPRPVYITAVDTFYAEAQSTNEFRVVWSEVEDAEYYYVTLYQDQTKIEHREVVHPNTAAIFNGLKSGTAYRVSVEAAEHKSCLENISPKKEITTYTASERKGSRLPVVKTEDGRYLVWTETPLPYGTVMALYTPEGQAVYTKLIDYGSINPEIPVDKLKKGNLYLIKLYENKFTRKDLWAKFIYK